MMIACDRCNTLIPTARIDRNDGEGTITITVECHGETDSMVLTDEWIAANRDFMLAIEHNATVGRAFREEREEA